MTTDTSTARTQNSVQFSLSELRQIHVSRLEAEKEAEVRRRIEAEMQQAEAERLRMAQAQEAEARRLAHQHEQEQRRLAAQHELELAKEKARLDAEARVQEKRLELEIKQAEAELARAQAMVPRKQGWAPILAVAILLLGLQGALFWQESRTESRLGRMDRAVADAREHEQTMSKSMDELEESWRHAAKQAEIRLNAIEHRLDAMKTGITSSSGKPVSQSSRPAGTNNHKEPKPHNNTGIVDLSKCAKDPLGCL